MTRKRTRFRFSFPESKHGDFVDVDDASPFDEAVSDSLSRACLETASSLPPISTLGSETAHKLVILKQKIEGISVRSIPPAIIHRHCFAQYEPASLQTYLPLLQ
jgi:hypothetical protein